MSEIPNDVLIELSQITDMGKNVASSVSDESDLSEIGSDELNVTTPPQRGALKKQSKKLRAKYRIMRHALIDEQIANIDKHIEQVRAGTHPRIRDAIFKVESKHKRRLEMLEERKKLYFGRINAIYNASCQAAVQDYRNSPYACSVYFLPSANQSQTFQVNFQRWTNQTIKAAENDIFLSTRPNPNRSGNPLVHDTLMPQNESNFNFLEDDDSIESDLAKILS